MKIRVFEAFCGYGSQALALQRLKDNFPTFDFDIVGVSEIDKYAVRAYTAIHGECPNYGDIRYINWRRVPDFDLLTYSFPCTDISIVGQMRVLERGSGTSSSLLWECAQAIKAKKPKYLIMENVKNLLSKRFIGSYQEWVEFLNEQGYTTYTQVLDALDYGVAQHRERVFSVSIFGGGDYSFPTKQVAYKTLDDVLEDDVEDKYYLSKKALQYFEKVNIDKSHNHKFKPLTRNDVAKTITTKGHNRADGNYIKSPKYGIGRSRDRVCRISSIRLLSHVNCLNTSVGSGSTLDSLVYTPRIIQVGNLYPDKEQYKNRSAGRIYSKEGCSPTLRSASGGNKTPIIISRPRGYNTGSISTVCPTITSSSFEHNNTVLNEQGIRRLTPRECFRLMDVQDNDIDKLLSSGLSNTRLYSLAGNSIVVNCLYFIMKNLFIEKQMPQQLKLFNI